MSEEAHNAFIPSLNNNHSFNHQSWTSTPDLLVLCSRPEEKCNFGIGQPEDDEEREGDESLVADREPCEFIEIARRSA